MRAWSSSCPAASRRIDRRMYGRSILRSRRKSGDFPDAFRRRRAGVCQGHCRGRREFQLSGRHHGCRWRSARFILTLYEKRVAAEDLPYFMGLLDHLADKGLRVPPAIKDREGRRDSELSGRPVLASSSSCRACRSRIPRSRKLGRRTAFGGHAPGRCGFPARPAEFHGRGHLAAAFLRTGCGRSLDQIAPGLHDDIDTALAAVLGSWMPKPSTIAPSCRPFPRQCADAGRQSDRPHRLLFRLYGCPRLRSRDHAHGVEFSDATGRDLRRRDRRGID